MRVIPLLVALAVLGTCNRDERTIAPQVSLAPRSVRVGDRFLVSIDYAQSFSLKTAHTTDSLTVTQVSLTATMRYEDEVREVAHGGAVAIRRRWVGQNQTTHIRVVDGRMDPRVDYFSQFDALLPSSSVRLGENWQVDSPLGPFNLHPGGLHVQVAHSEAVCTLARVESDGKSEVAVLNAHLKVSLADGAKLTLAGTLEFDLSQRILRAVRIRYRDRPVFVATRTLQAAQ